MHGLSLIHIYGDEKSLGKLMDFLRKQQGNEKSHTVEGDKVNSAIDGLIEKVGMFAMEKQAISCLLYTSVGKIKEENTMKERLVAIYARVSTEHEAQISACYHRHIFLHLHNRIKYQATADYWQN